MPEKGKKTEEEILRELSEAALEEGREVRKTITQTPKRLVKHYTDFELKYLGYAPIDHSHHSQENKTEASSDS